MNEIQVVVEGVSGAAMTRELAQRVNRIEDLEGLLRHKPAEPGSKSVIGEAAFTFIKIASEKAIGPLLEILGSFINRDKKARIKLKLPNGTELEIESANMQNDLQQVREMLKTT
jgi:hypothetical protein